MSRTDGPERGRKTEDLYGKSVLRPRRREAARREPAEHDNISTAKPPGWAALLFPSPCSSEPYVTKKGSVHSSAAAGGTQTEAQRQRVRFGEEEQGSAAQLSPSGGSGAKRTLRRRGRRPHWRCLPEGPRLRGDRQRRQPKVRSAARDSEKRGAVGSVPPQNGLCSDEFARLVCKRSLDSRLL